MSSSGESFTRGTRVGRYTIMKLIGSGGMGDVYLAEDTELNRKAALKFQSGSDSVDPALKGHFIQEAQLAASLNHPNIVTIYEVGEYRDRPFIAMEYVDGDTLQELIDSEELPLENSIDAVIQICDGLSEAHRAGLVHQDIKPSNIFIDKSGRVRILDFGLARIEGGIRLSSSVSPIGTISYMSPEQAKGEKIDNRSDIFSVGVILYRLLSGRLPFAGNYEAAILYTIVYQKPAPLTDYNDNIPQGFVRIVDKALEKNPQARYQKIEELRDAIINVHDSKEVVHNIVDNLHSPSIAILQFSDLSPQKDQEYFCDGMADEIINALAGIDGLRVASRTATLQFKGQEHNIRKIGQLLSVDAILEGSVRLAGDKVRITVQLVNVDDGYYLWSEKYDRDMSDLFAIQDEISQSVAEKLMIRLKRDISGPHIKRYTENLEAYDLYLRGRYFWNRRYEGGLQRSMEYFQQAIEHDPTYALAYAGLADSFNICAFYNFMSPLDACPRAKAAAARAVELDPNLAEAHTALAWATTFFDWNWPEAEKIFHSALELNPNYATAHHYYALYLLAMSRMDEGLIHMQRALELDPLSLIICTSVGAAYYFNRDHQESIIRHQKALELDPNFPLAHAYLAGPLVCLGKHDEAIIECRKAGALSGGSNYAAAFLGYTYGISGQEDKAVELLKMLLDLGEKGYVSAHLISLIYIGLNNKDNAFKWLKKACDERDNWLVWLKIHPVFDSLRSDSRFTDLLERVGLK